MALDPTATLFPPFSPTEVVVVSTNEKAVFNYHAAVLVASALRTIALTLNITCLDGRGIPVLA